MKKTFLFVVLFLALFFLGCSSKKLNTGKLLFQCEWKYNLKSESWTVPVLVEGDTIKITQPAFEGMLSFLEKRAIVIQHPNLKERYEKIILSQQDDTWIIVR